MPLKYSGPEVMEMAIQTERGGKLFYESVADATQDEALACLFRHLASEEIKHIAVFQEIARSIAERPEESPYMWEEAIPYLDAIVNSRYFLGDDKALALAGITGSPAEALTHALAFEKETLLFYTEVIGMVADRNRPAVERLIAEEKSHIVRLKQLQDGLSR